MLNEATEIGVLRISGDLCAYIALERSENAEISTLDGNHVGIQLSKKKEFMESSRNKHA